MKTFVSFVLLVFLVSCAPNPRAASSNGAAAEPVFVEVTPAQTSVGADTPAASATAAPAAATESSGLEVIVNSPQLEPGEPVPAAAANPPAVVPPPTAPGAPSTGPVAAVPPATSETAPTITAAPELRPEMTLANPDEIVPAGMIDFRNMPLEQALTVYSEYVNRTLLRPASLPASQITLTTKTALTRREIIQALDAVLGLNGIAMINVGEKFVKAVPQTQAVQEAAPPDTRASAELPELGPIITHVVQLKYSKPEDVVPALQPFAKLNSILPVPSTAVLVLRDYTENIKRMLEMVEKIDIVVPGEFVSEVIPIKYAKASEIAEALNSLSGGGGSASIGSTGGGTTGGTSTRAGGMRSTMGGFNRGGTMGGYNQGGFGQQGGIGGSSAFGNTGGAAGGSSFSDNLRRIVQRAATSGDLEILGKTKMIADERSNSLLIFATRADMEMIKTIVEKLDVVLSQVLIETVILDVNLDRSLSYGVTAGQPPKTNNLGAVGGVYNNAGGLGTLANFFGSGVSNGFPTSSGLTYFGRYKGELDVAVTAFAGTSRANVIQKPRILTSHARPGSIFVGRTVPYVTSAYYGGGFGGGPSSSYQQLRVGIGLQVTPFINPEGLVVMEIQQEIEEIQGSTPIEGVGEVPNTITRSITGEVAVNDGDTIILGGFIRNSSERTDSGVPLLKDIPLLGALFSSRSNQKLRNELLVLMRPTVLKTPEIAATASEQEKKRLPGVVNAEREFQDLENSELEKEEKRAAAHKKAQERKKQKEKAREE